MQDISKSVPSYSIEFEKKADYDELLLQFNRIRRTAYYQHNKHYGETAIIMCLSHNKGDMCKKIIVKTEKGGYKKVFVRDKDNLLCKLPIPHEVDWHIHFLSVGKGSRSLCEKVAHNENRRAKRCVAKLYSNKGFIPYNYIKEQASFIREIGNMEQYLQDLYKFQ